MVKKVVLETVAVEKEDIYIKIVLVKQDTTVI